MEIKRSITLLLPDDDDLKATVKAFGQLRRDLSEAAYNGGKALSHRDLHKAIYYDVKGRLSSQMILSVFRSVCGAYAAAKSNKRPAKSAFRFRKNLAVFLIGQRGRDARFIKNTGKLTIWTINGRKKLEYKIPEAFRHLFDSAKLQNSLTLSENPDGTIRADLVLTVEVPDIKPGKPVGIDLNETNAVVAVDLQGRTFFETGLKTRVKNHVTTKTVRRLQSKLSTLKADGHNTRSVRRAIKRLSRKRSRRTKDFARCVAKKLVNWAGPNSTFVLEKLKFDRRRKWHLSKKVNQRLNKWPHALIRKCITNKAELAGCEVVDINPAFTSQTCSKCGNLGNRKRHSFGCPTCGFSEHADVNAAINIRNKYTGSALPASGPAVNRPRSTAA